MRILLTSAGNLLTTYSLDALVGRRDTISVWGCGNNPQAPDLERLDGFCQVPSSGEEQQWLTEVTRFLNQQQIDLVIPCSERDVCMTATLSSERYSGTAFAVGARDFADVVADKWLTSQFARNHDLPFASTVSSATDRYEFELEELVRQSGFPLIAKPRFGFGSRGVRFITTEAQLSNLISRVDEPTIFQEYLSPESLPGEMVAGFDAGFPLWQAEPDGRTFGIQAVIAPDGEVAGKFTFQARNELGKTWWLAGFQDPSLDIVGEQWIAAAVAAGWRGVLNIQTRLSPGGYVPIEVAGRISGGISARYLCGFDEIGLLCRSFLGQELPQSSRCGSAEEVVRVLRDFEPSSAR